MSLSAKAMKVVRMARASFASRRYSSPPKNGTVVQCGALDKGVLVGGATGPAVPERRVSTTGPMGSSEFAKYNCCSSGVWIEFSTDAPSFDIEIVLDSVILPNNMSLDAACGVDVFERAGDDLRWIGLYAASSAADPTIAIHHEICGEPRERVFRVYAPLFARLRVCRMSADEAATFGAPAMSCQKKPLLFYGSSVTQGCAAARPSLTYPVLAGSTLGRDVINFGFSSSAYGEVEIAAAIGALDVGGVVVEYDHNVECDELRNTHERFVRTIRKCNPDVPLLLMTRTSGGLSISDEETRERIDIVRATFDRLKEEGDDRVAFLCGDEVFPRDHHCRGCCKCLEESYR